MRQKKMVPGKMIAITKIYLPDWILTVLLALTFVSTACTQSSTQSTAEAGIPALEIIGEMSQTNPELADVLSDIYEDTKRFMDIEVALEEGYIRDPMDACETAPMMGQPEFMGAMGVHYLRPDLLGITQTEPRVYGEGLHTDFRDPSILIYEPQEDGSMTLVAIENLVFQKAWHGAGHEGPPDFMDYDYFAMVNNPLTEADEAHMFEPHYDLHMWLYRKNPHGLFTPFNPEVSCENHEGGGH